MSGWSTTFTVIALAMVILTLVGTWMAVRVLRARRPTPDLHHDEHHGEKERDRTHEPRRHEG